MFPKLKFLFDVDDANGHAVEIPDDIDSDLDLLGDDANDQGNDDKDDAEDLSDKNDDNDESGDKDDDADKNDDDKEDEGEEDGKKKKKEDGDEEEPTEEELATHSYSDIKKKYPNFFKEFPGLKKAFFREQEFTKLFPTVDDAREAIKSRDNFEAIRDTVMSGDAQTFLAELKGANPKALESFSENFLTDLIKVDEKLYYDITTPVIEDIFKGIYKKATHKKDKNLGNAAIVAFQEIFGGDFDDVAKALGAAPQARNKKEDDPEREEFNKERNEFLNQKRDTLRNEVWSGIEKDLTREIEKGLDPTNSIRPGLKKLITEKIFSRIVSEISKDEAHIKRMDEIWARESKAKYSGAYKDSLKTTYMSRAKALVPKIRNEVRAEIVGAQKNSDKNKQDKLNKGAQNRQQVVGKDSKNNNSQKNSKDALKGKSDLEFLST